MDFKKNWSKLAIAVITGILGILFVVAIFVGEEFSLLKMNIDKLSGLDILDLGGDGAFSMFALMWLIPAIFFLGTCAYMILKLLKIDIAKYVLLAIGAINLILFIIVLIDAPEIPGITGTELYRVWGPLAIFALLPLIKGVKKVIGCKDCAK